MFSYYFLLVILLILFNNFIGDLMNEWFTGRISQMNEGTVRSITI